MLEGTINTLDQLNELYKENFRDKQEDIVLGEGCKNPRLVVVGEAPGREEVYQKRPFVGKAGKNLDFFLSKLGVERSEIYITNAIKYRLKKVSSKSGGFINRPATREDITSNLDFLHRELSLLRPKFIITLGNVALRAVTNISNINIGDVHGRMNSVVIEDFVFLLCPLYHPASIIYNSKLKDVYLDDIENFKLFINFNPLA